MPTNLWGILPVVEGDRIAQLIIERIETPAVLEVDVSLLAYAVS